MPTVDPVRVPAESGGALWVGRASGRRREQFASCKKSRSLEAAAWDAKSSVSELRPCKCFPGGVW